MRHIEPLQSAGLAATAAKREGRKPKPNRPRLPLLLVGLSVGLFVLTCCVELVLGTSDVAATVIGAPGFGAATILALLGAVKSFYNHSRGQTVVEGPHGDLFSVLVGLFGFGMTAVCAFTTLFAVTGF